VGSRGARASNDACVCAYVRARCSNPGSTRGMSSVLTNVGDVDHYSDADETDVEEGVGRPGRAATHMENTSDARCASLSCVPALSSHPCVHIPYVSRRLHAMVVERPCAWQRRSGESRAEGGEARSECCSRAVVHPRAPQMLCARCCRSGSVRDAKSRADVSYEYDGSRVEDRSRVNGQRTSRRLNPSVDRSQTDWEKLSDG
jgi:hypothetical protein